MDETLWELFWTTGLPEAYALAKEIAPSTGTEGAGPLPAAAGPAGNAM